MDIFSVAQQGLIEWLSPVREWLMREGRWPSVAMVLGWLGLMRALRYSGWRLALVSLPGTVLHEASHYFVGLLLLARPVSVSLIPRRQGRQWVLGSVQFVGLNLINAAPVAFAPLLLLWGGVAMFDQWLVPALRAEQYGVWLLASYLVACSLFSALPSTADLKLGVPSGLLWCAVGYGVSASPI